MSFVQALKRLITTNDSSSTSGTAINDPNQSIPDNVTNINHTSTNSNGSNSAMLTSKSHENFKPLSQGLQKKYARGVQYNMKLVIRGECNTGKSVLWSRLQGCQFVEDYVPSDEIRVATINWSSRVCGDAIIKVEVWDVVDKSRKKRRPINPSLKLSNTINVPVAEVSLDAEFLDVYKSTAGVLFIYDITKPWTWDYIEREIVKVPAHIPILIIGNQLDMCHHRKVPIDACLSFIENLDRGTMGSVVRYCESSMRNGFGLQYIYQFLNIPFLQLQRECLLQQLQVNARDMDTSLEEIDTYSHSAENNYDLFIEMLNNKRRSKQEALAGDIVAKAKPLEEAKRIHDEALQAAALAEQQQQQQTKSSSINTIVQVIKKTTESPPSSIKPTPTTKQKPPIVAVQPIVQQAVPKSAIYNEVNDNIVDKQHHSSDDYTETQLSNPLVTSTVDDFIPDDNDYETFLVDDNTTSQQQQQQQQHLSIDTLPKSSTTKLSTTDDENESTVNPMVKGFCEQLDSDDEQHQQPIITNESTEYEPVSPTVEIITQPISPPVYHQISTFDLDYLDRLSSSKSQQSNNELHIFDSQSTHSDSTLIKSKKKKTTTTTTKPKKETNVATTESAKTKKKKKSSPIKTNNSTTNELPTANTNDDDDLESFLADNPTTTSKSNHDYEHV
ncbi:unnamed protein product [Rotaria sordida]|uniref:Rab-like protein 6 n=1 Tax=Rotaria sordida TaxID=392033 RepID=A0A813NFI8_9BILA|nr:unnamed protein product [Rotaria sordida]CAF0732590.1 unnamed protein product [Rotaria sordida]